MEKNISLYKGPLYDSRTLPSRKIKSLGWKPKVGLREGIEKTYELYKESL